MATQQPYALQNASHGAALFRQAVFSLVNSGGGSKGGVMNAADLVAAAQSTPNMSVQVSAGRVWVPGTQVSSIGSGWSTQAGYFGINDASVSVTIATANATNPRIDVIYVAVQDSFYSGTNNQTVLGVVTGTPAASPAAPAVPSNALALAQVTVAANATSITSGNITNTPTASLLACTLGGIDVAPSTGGPNGTYIDQYRGHPTSGLQRWDGSNWHSPIPTAYGGATSALVGSVPTAGTLLITKTWSGSLTSDGSGDATVTFPSAFPNGLLSVAVGAAGYGGVLSTAPSGGYVWQPYAPSLSQVKLRLFTAGSAGAVAGGVMNASVTAIGW